MITFLKPEKRESARQIAVQGYRHVNSTLVNTVVSDAMRWRLKYIYHILVRSYALALDRIEYSWFPRDRLNFFGRDSVHFESFTPNPPYASKVLRVGRFLLTRSYIPTGTCLLYTSPSPRDS